MPSPRPSPRRHAAALSRRAALLGAVGTATTACSPYDLQTQQRRPVRPSPTKARVAAVDPDVELATSVVAAARTLLHQIDATMRRHPRLERVLTKTREVHEAHVSLFEEAVPTDTGSAADGPSSDAGATDPGPVPGDPARALQVVATAEDGLALTAKQAAFAAQSGAFARVLASMAAAAAQQSATLRADRLRGGRG